MKYPDNWRERAIRFLMKNTRAMLITIERFVDCHWVVDVSAEENLENFHVYEGDLEGVYAY